MNQKTNWWTAAIAGAVLCGAAVPAAASDSDSINKSADRSVQGEEVALLTFAPNVPPPITRKHATRVKVELEVKEVMRKLADGVEYVFWTFGGEVPGEFIRIREGDLVERQRNRFRRAASGFPVASVNRHTQQRRCQHHHHKERGGPYSTVTLLARLRGLSTSQPRETAM